MTAHGGARPNSGRKPRATAAASVRVTVWLTAAERDALTDGLRAGETISGVLRDGGLLLVRGRT